MQRIRVMVDQLMHNMFGSAIDRIKIDTLYKWI